MNPPSEPHGHQLADTWGDRLFQGAINDLVVNRDSMFALTAWLPADRIAKGLCCDAAAEVDQTGYLFDPRVARLRAHRLV